MSDRQIQFIVDDDDTPVKSARSAFDHVIAARSSKVIDVQLKALATQLHEKLADLNEALSVVDTSAGPYDIDSVSLTMAVTSTGKIAILSTIEGSVSPQAGLHITLKRRGGGADDHS